MAELKRLKQIVDVCRQQERSSQRTWFYLLDEILQGTNSAERHIAVSQVIRVTSRRPLVDHLRYRSASRRRSAAAVSPFMNRRPVPTCLIGTTVKGRRAVRFEADE